MSVINLLVIGCGRIGKMHVDNILKGFSDINIVGIVDNKIDETWLTERQLKHYEKSDLGDLLKSDKVDAVLIAASSSEHVALIELCAKAHKHIFCEKPISFKPADLDHVLKLSEENKLKLQVGLNRRYDASFMKVKHAVDNGSLGTPQIIKITNRDPKRPSLDFIPRSGGLFFDFTIHDFDMARYITGQEVTSVFAMGANLVDPGIGKLGDIDTAIITLTMDQGALCVIDASRETHYGYDQQVEVLGSKGKIHAKNTRPTTVQLQNNMGTSTDQPHYSFVERYANAYQQQLSHFFESIRTNTPITAGAKDIKQAVLIAQAALTSFQENRAVLL